MRTSPIVNKRRVPFAKHQQPIKRLRNSNLTGPDRSTTRPRLPVYDRKTTGTIDPTTTSWESINSDGMFDPVRLHDGPRQRINCFGYALGINMAVSEPQLLKRQAFLQIDSFQRMVQIALKVGGNRSLAVIADMLKKEILRMGSLHSKYGLIEVIRADRPSQANTQKKIVFSKLGMIPTYYRFAVFAALDPLGGGAHADFHFAREYASNRWSHKPGSTPATELDTGGFPLDPKESCRLGRLRVGLDGPTYAFCGYMWVMSRVTRHKISAYLGLNEKDALITALEQTA